MSTVLTDDGRWPYCQARSIFTNAVLIDERDSYWRARSLSMSANRSSSSISNILLISRPKSPTQISAIRWISIIQIYIIMRISVISWISIHRIFVIWMSVIHRISSIRQISSWWRLSVIFRTSAILIFRSGVKRYLLDISVFSWISVMTILFASRISARYPADIRHPDCGGSGGRWWISSGENLKEWKKD